MPNDPNLPSPSPQNFTVEALGYQALQAIIGAAVTTTDIIPRAVEQLALMVEKFGSQTANFLLNQFGYQITPPKNDDLTNQLQKLANEIDTVAGPAWRAPDKRTVTSSDLRKIKELLETGADINVFNMNNDISLMKAAIFSIKDLDKNPLFYAIHLNDLEMIRYFSTKGFINHQDRNGMTPLMLASADDATYQALIDAGADVTHQDSLGMTVMHQAFKEYKPTLAGAIRILIENNAPIDSRENNRNLTPLAAAFEYQNYSQNRKALTYLIKNGASISEALASFQLCINKAVRLGWGAKSMQKYNDAMQNMMQLVLEVHPEFLETAMEGEDNPAFFAAKHGYTEVLRTIQKFTKISVSYLKNEQDLSLLVVSSINGHKECASTLINHNTIENDLLSLDKVDFAQGLEGATIITNILLEKGAKQESNFLNKEFQKECNPIFWASKSGAKTFLTNALMHKDTKANAQDENSMTALFFAKDEETIRTLLRGGVDPNIQDKEGRTAAQFIKETINEENLANVIDDEVQEIDQEFREKMTLAGTAISAIVVSAFTFIAHKKKQKTAATMKIKVQESIINKYVRSVAIGEEAESIIDEVRKFVTTDNPADPHNTRTQIQREALSVIAQLSEKLQKVKQENTVTGTELFERLNRIHQEEEEAKDSGDKGKETSLRLRNTSSRPEKSPSITNKDSTKPLADSSRDIHEI